jgi:hypothetical protein
MSREFHYRQVLPVPEGEYIEYSLGRAIADAVDVNLSIPFTIKKGDQIHWFIKGLAHSGWEGSTDLDAAIERLGEIEIYVVH